MIVFSLSYDCGCTAFPSLLQEAKQRNAGKVGDSNGVGAVTSESDLEHSTAGSVAYLLSPDHGDDEKKEQGTDRSEECSLELRQVGEDTDKKNIDTSNL